MTPLLHRWIATALCVLAAAVRADDARPPAPDVHAPMALEAGTWDVAVDFFDPVSGAPNGSAKGRQVNTPLANGHWISNDLEIWGADGRKVDFAGRGTWGWDPVAKEYVDAWVDTNDGAMRIDHGFWVAEQRALYWTAQQPDGEGHSVTYRMKETFAGDVRTLEFFQVALQSGRQIKLAEIHFTRRADGR
jgi:hypothetical protein